MFTHPRCTSSDVRSNAGRVSFRCATRTDTKYAHAHTSRSFDYYNRSRSLATMLSFRKWFPPDGSRQSERISTWFPRTVRARTFAFRRRSRSVFSVVLLPFFLPSPPPRPIARSLKRNAKRKFRKKNEYVDKGKFTGSGKQSAPFLFFLVAFQFTEYRRDLSQVWSYINIPHRGTKLSNLLEAKRSVD